MTNEKDLKALRAVLERPMEVKFNPACLGEGFSMKMEPLVLQSSAEHDPTVPTEWPK